MYDGKKLIASCSFGKDSLAAITVSEKHGVHIDEAVYCRIMFDEDTSAELPEHEEFIFCQAIPLLESRYGIKTSVVQAGETYQSCFFTRFERGKRTGQIYGFPFLRGPWCNSRLKMRPIKEWQRRAGDFISVVGIAADEIKRIERKTVSNSFLPLVEYGVTEAEAFEICRKSDLLSPAYSGDRTRLGCWFCHNQRVSELRRLRREHPEFWAKLLELDAVRPYSFKLDCTLGTFDERFANEDAQLSLFGA